MLIEDILWDAKTFYKNVNRWAQKQAVSFEPLEDYAIKETLGCTYRELMEEPYESVLVHMKIKERIDHYADR